MRVALMVTCVNDALFPGTGRAVVDVLTRLGVDVDFPEGQTCCGQPMVNSGYVVVVDSTELPVSRRHTRELKDKLVRAAKQEWR